MLGVAVEAWSETGDRVVGDVGDMIITRPLPSMPVFFWGDTEGAKYRSSYFEKFPGVWTHGDWITETADGAFVVHGRSDATLNRGGVRLGSADIYAALQHVPEVSDSLVIGLEQPNGGYYMPLFVTLAPGVPLSAELDARIRSTIREHTSPRHVPARILQVEDIPRTRSGKITELAVRDVVHGREVKNVGALVNPEALAHFRNRPELES